MPEYLSPGVYIEEVDSGPRPIEATGTATAAFVGFAPGGPVNQPVLTTNWTQFVETFGSLDEGGRRNPHIPGAYLSHAVYGYFLNGGGRCYITRLAPLSSNGSTPGEGTSSLSDEDTLQLPSRSSSSLPSLSVSPKGAPSDDIQIEVAPPAGDDASDETFTLKIRMGTVEESYENVGLGRRASKHVVETVNQASELIVLVEEQASGPISERIPETGTYVLKAQKQVNVPQVRAGHFTGSAAERTGVEGLEIASDVTMICCPDLMSAYESNGLNRDAVKAVQMAMIAHCENMGDRMAILDPLPDLTPQEAKAWREQETNYDSKFAALYYPWIRVAGPDGQPLSIPPSGHMAGIWARNDNQRGVHKAPANEVIRGALEAVIPITKGEQDTLNPIGVNCIRSFTGRGLRVWGARTLSSDPAWRYVNVRRLFNFIETSIENGTQWVVFEPNDPDLWARVRRDVGSFLTGTWRDGMLFGRTPEEAFYVKCDEELNPPDVRDRGQLVIEIGLAPVKPAEFVIFRLSQWAGGGA